MSEPSPGDPSSRLPVALLVAGFVILFVVVGGGIDTVSVFLNALSVGEGWSRKALSAGISVGVLSAGLATPAVGVLIDRFGVRLPMTLGSLLLALGFGVLVWMSEPWHFIGANLLLGAGFAAAAMLPITVVVTVQVPTRTALALGIVGVGSSAGALVLAPALQLVIDAAGWRTAYAILGLVIVLTPGPFLLLALPRGRLHHGSQGTVPRARSSLVHDLRRPGVGLLTALLVVPGLVSFGVAVHLVPYLADQGHTTPFAASALGVAIGISAIGKVGGGWMGDRAGALRTLRLALLLDALAVAILPLSASATVAGLFVAAHGLAIGAGAAVMPVIAIGILGRERFATLYGVLQLGSTVAIALAPIVPGVIYDSSGSYEQAVLFWMGAMGLALLLALRLRMPEPRLQPSRSS